MKNTGTFFTGGGFSGAFSSRPCWALPLPSIGELEFWFAFFDFLRRVQNALIRDIFFTGRAGTFSGDASPLTLGALEVREERPEQGWKVQYLKREL